MYRAPTNPRAGRTAGLRRPALQEWPRLRGEGDDAEGAAGAADDFERCSDDHSASGRQRIEIAKAGKAKLSAAVHDEMVCKGRVKLGGLTCVGTDCFDSHTQNVAFASEELRTFLRAARRVRAVVLEVDV